jgi:phosphoribosylanthranilate isomerase
MRNPENIRDAATLDLDWMGFICYEKSKRYVSVNEEKCIQAIRACRKTKVGVFVNAHMNEIVEKAALFQLDLLQLHGQESVSQCEKLKNRSFRIIKAFSIETVRDLKKVHAYKDAADYLLFDTKCEGYGGSGKRFDWSVLDAYEGNIPFLLSGGISPDSLPDLLQLQHPRMLGIDLNSGFENAPACKDTGKLKLFIEQLKSHHQNNRNTGK